jgi:hypothetical protein
VLVPSGAVSAYPTGILNAISLESAIALRNLRLAAALPI